MNTNTNGTICDQIFKYSNNLNYLSQHWFVDPTTSEEWAILNLMILSLMASDSVSMIYMLSNLDDNLTWVLSVHE